MEHVKGILATLRKLAMAIPTFAPDFTNQEVAEVWAEELMDLTPEELGRAAKHLIKIETNFPSIAKFRNAVRPPVDEKAQAVEVADLIWSAICRHGLPNPKPAEKAMGELAWAVVIRMGGWANVCTSIESMDQMQSWKAQTRETARAYQARARLGGLGQLPQIPGAQHTPGLTSSRDLASEVLSAIPLLRAVK